MKRKTKSNNLSTYRDKNLSAWDKAIVEAKLKIKELKQSIRGFEELRDMGMEFSEPLNFNSGRRKTKNI